MPRHFGHRAGIRPLRETVRHAARTGVPNLTVFAFSSENWSRPKEEVGRLMSLFLDALDREVAELQENDVQLHFVGALDALSTELQEKIAAAMVATGENAGLRLNVAVAYGGRWDIVNAVRSLAMTGADLTRTSEAELASHLQLTDCPEPDLLIRTGGEVRISNFLLWQLAYSELWFTDTLWPDFEPGHFDAALEYYRSRERRRGRTTDQVVSAKC